MSGTRSSDLHVELIEKTTHYDGYFRMDTYRLRHERFGGGWTDPFTRELFERGDAALVLPYDPVRDTVVLIEQFRIGAYAAGLSPWLVEAVAGIVEPGEAAENVVRREALEEAGCAITALEEIGPVLPSPGGVLGAPLPLLRPGRQRGRGRHPWPGPRARGHPRLRPAGRGGVRAPGARRIPQRQPGHPPAVAGPQSRPAQEKVGRDRARPLSRCCRYPDRCPRRRPFHRHRRRYRKYPRRTA